MGNLKHWADKQSNFIKLTNDQIFSGQYLGYEESSFNGQPTINYKFNVLGENKTLSSGSTRLAREMDKVKPKDHVNIKKFGEGFNTSFEVTILDQNQGWDE